MDNESLKARILEIAPDAQHEENKQYLTFLIPAGSLHNLALKLKNDPDLSFDYLFCLSGVDYGKQLGIVYHLTSTLQKHSLVIKVRTDDRINPAFDTMSNIWRTAELHERKSSICSGSTLTIIPTSAVSFLKKTGKATPCAKIM